MIGKNMETTERINLLNKAFRTLQSQGKVRTQGDFARLLGISQNSISAAKNGDERYLTDNLVERIQAIMEQASPAPDTMVTVPVLPTEAMAGTLGDFALAVQDYECERMVSPVKGADFAIKIQGDSMSPEYPSGSVCLIKKVNEKAFIEWGKVYVLDTENGAVIKQIRRTDRENVVECVSLNPAFQPFTIDCSYIKGWYRILMMISLK